MLGRVFFVLLISAFSLSATFVMRGNCIICSSNSKKVESQSVASTSGCHHGSTEKKSESTKSCNMLHSCCVAFDRVQALKFKFFKAKEPSNFAFNLNLGGDYRDSVFRPPIA